jgi:hypothetical protein
MLEKPGRIGLLVLVPFLGHRDVFGQITTISGELLFDVYREHKGFFIRKKYIF